MLSYRIKPIVVAENFIFPGQSMRTNQVNVSIRLLFVFERKFYSGKHVLKLQNSALIVCDLIWSELFILIRRTATNQCH